jgi:hypothetical protein
MFNLYHRQEYTVHFGLPKAISEAQKFEAIRMMNEGRSAKDVARLFATSEPTMRRIKNLANHSALCDAFC